MYRIKFTEEELQHILDVLWDVDKYNWSKENRELNNEMLNVVDVVSLVSVILGE